MIFVLADDLTGAAEMAGICLRYGLDVSFGIDTIPEKEATVNIIATDTRSMTEDEAYEVHFHLAEEIISKKNYTIFKKCDSVLRGHVLTELSALIDVTEKNSILLQPSNPEGSRCIEKGIYWVNNDLIENTGFAADPDFPAKTSQVKNLVLDRTTKKSHVEVFSGVFQAINSKGIFIPDCDSVEALSKCINLYNEEMIIGGSAAFFEQFLIKKRLVTSKINNKTQSFSENYMLLSGSAHPESIRFSKTLEIAKCPLIVFTKSLLEHEFSEAAINDFVVNMSNIYNENKKIVLRISNTVIQFENRSLNLKNRMSLVAKRFLEVSSVNELFIEGGATAYDVLEKLNWQSFTPIEELALGVVRMQYDKNPDRFITIKPGSYQWPEGLLN
ncbi:four-carbon acid sugar kinase family protein [Mariniflexile litorale]|uniref:Four-carbon acid sugar kinase family protein n=1 Tax=Mariniflexile litorale TaxID=3045158 RepID=A0AAU7ELA2_9FLAO|nr:four-carbon acid sugar kinase family protein [Mariniflexile sp. KMM 9835]MDQ8210608.1 four-carbon acid sugar kinase family protein [Mariniflexile sp. KMM 9835]